MHEIRFVLRKVPALVPKKFNALLFTACAYNSGVVSMGNGEYLVAKQAASGFNVSMSA